MRWYKQTYVTGSESTLVEWDEVSDVEYVWERMNHALLDSASKGCGSGILRMRRKKRKGEWGNDKVVVERERDCV